jgi:hypothetical protein
MGLPAGQQRVLDGMERTLQSCEPKLTAMFAIFARLTKDETTPRIEALDGRWFSRGRGRWQLAAGHRGTAARIVLIPVLLASVVAVIVLGGLTTPAGRTCSLVRQTAVAAPAARAWICPAAAAHH